MVNIAAQPKRMSIHNKVNQKMQTFAGNVRRELGYWNIREIARRLDVDHRYVRDYLKQGKEPPDTTIQGQTTRLKLFLPQMKRKKTQRPQQRITVKPDWVRKRNPAHKLTTMRVVEIAATKKRMHITPDRARTLAMELIAAAEAADQDTFIFDIFKREIGATEKDAARALKAYRNERRSR